MRQSSQIEMILWTLAAVVLVGAGVFASVLQPPESIKFAQKKPENRSKNGPKNGPETRIESDRAPASYSGIDIDDKGSQAVDFTLPCNDRGSFSQNIVQVRLTGRLCGRAAKQDVETSEIRNLTNGFSATVFPIGTKSNEFTTDYITLAVGENHIQIRHTLKSGLKIDREFVIERN